MTSAASGLVPVHIGQPAPGSVQDLQQRARAEQPDQRGRREQAPRVPADLDWAKHGLQPRWLAEEASDCAIAIEPGVFSSQGANERKRFLAGAARRNEVALLVSLIGDQEGDGVHNPMSIFAASASVHIHDLYTSVAGRRLPVGSVLELVPGLGRADRDLALRLRNRPADAPWWALELHGATTYPGAGGGPTVHEPEGRLEPILVNNLGEPVAAVWVPPDGSQRWYVLPDAVDWATVLDWLMQMALPEYGPTVLRRVRSPRFIDPDLQTDDELVARRDLAELEAQYADDKVRLEQAVLAAREQAEPIRQGLLYGSGTSLVNAVHAVLAAAGLHVVDLDQELGATHSADLLVSIAGTRRPWLVEIKGTSGRPPENLVADLQRHLNTWPQLRPGQPVGGGVLIVNHQHKLDPAERDAEVYTRKEFVETLPVTVLSARKLFDWWRVSDWAAIRTAVCGSNLTSANPADRMPADPQVPAAPSAERRRWWRRRA